MDEETAFPNASRFSRCALTAGCLLGMSTFIVLVNHENPLGYAKLLIVGPTVGYAAGSIFGILPQTSTRSTVVVMGACGILGAIASTACGYLLAWLFGIL